MFDDVRMERTNHWLSKIISQSKIETIVCKDHKNALYTRRKCWLEPSPCIVHCTFHSKDCKISLKGLPQSPSRVQNFPTLDFNIFSSSIDWKWNPFLHLQYLFNFPDSSSCVFIINNCLWWVYWMYWCYWRKLDCRISRHRLWKINIIIQNKNCYAQG